jgi:hypothetical protein
MTYGRSLERLNRTPSEHARVGSALSHIPKPNQDHYAGCPRELEVGGHLRSPS